MLASLNISLLPKLLSNCAKIRSKGSFFNYVGQNLPVIDQLFVPSCHLQTNYFTVSQLCKYKGKSEK